MTSPKNKILVVANILIPIVCFGILSFLSANQGDYNEIFQPTGVESLIDPSSYTFSIWGPIFFLLSIFLVHQARSLFKKEHTQSDMAFVNEVSIYFVLSTVLTSFWFVAWLNRVIGLATIFMVFYLVSLVIGYLRLDINHVNRPRIEKLAVVTPWSMYTGWVTTATIVSVTTFLVSTGFNDPPFIFSDIYWAVLVLLVALAIYLAVLITRNDKVFAGVGIWALAGILIEQLTASVLVPEIVLTIIIGIIVLTIAIVYQVHRKT